MKINIQDITEKDFLVFNDIPLLDCHVHAEKTEGITRLEDIWQRYRIDKMNILATSSYSEKRVANNAICLLFKLRHPGKAFGFGSLYYPPSGTPTDGKELLEQAQWLMSLGFDGMKMLDGKPDNRKRIGIPLDSPIYDPYFDYLVENKLPLLYHVNDPAIFWDKEKVPQYVIDLKWAYLDDSFVSKDGLYREIDGILEKHPGLKVIFAHFYFMDDESIERASAFLDRWPDVSFDVTPGWLFKSFARDLDGWRAFFIKYQDRILFGTDNDYGISKELIYVIRTVLETDNEIEFWNIELHGMKLDRTVLEKIYGANFRRYAGTCPKKVETAQVIEECNRITRRAQNSPLKDNLLQDVQDVLDELKSMGVR
jgi:predicted TIM-barrel fold metal-dependent hydrolase